jgi:hypothetical protein
VRIPTTITPAAYGALLAAPRRRVATRAVVLDQNEQPVGASVPILGGQVSVDADAAVTRTCELSAVDPERKLGFDAGSPGAGALYADRFVQVDYGIADAAGVVHWLGIFRGPIVRYERSHPEVAITAQGKESLGLAPNMPKFKGLALQVVQGSRTDDAIEALAAGMGEQRLDVPKLPDRLGRTVSVGRNKELWPALRKVASDAGCQAFYDGDGWLRVRRRPAKVVWSFGDELLTWPAITYDLGDDFRNIVRVTGRARSGRSGQPPTFVAEPPPGDPLSPRSLARNGAPRYVAEYLEVEATSSAKCKRIAQSELAGRMRQSVSVDFDCLTVPGLEESDPVQVVLPGESAPVQFVAQRFAYGLGVDQMTVGTTRRVRTRRPA